MVPLGVNDQALISSICPSFGITSSLKAIPIMRLFFLWFVNLGVWVFTMLMEVMGQNRIFIFLQIFAIVFYFSSFVV